MGDTDLTVGAGGIATLTLTRAPVNALSPDMLDEIADRVSAAATDVSVRALVIKSPFKVFSAGMDLKLAQTFDQAGAERAGRSFTLTYRALYAFPKPVVCAVGGAAIAGGFFFPVCADIRIGTQAAKFGISEVRVGATLPVGALEIARAELPPPVFRRLHLTGQPIDADAALAAGILDRIVAPAALDDAALAEATALADLPPKTYAATKADLRRPALDAIDAALAAGAHAPGKAWFGAETKSAMARMIS